MIIIIPFIFPGAVLRAIDEWDLQAAVFRRDDETLGGGEEGTRRSGLHQATGAYDGT